MKRIQICPGEDPLLPSNRFQDVEEKTKYAPLQVCYFKGKEIYYKVVKRRNRVISRQGNYFSRKERRVTMQRILDNSRRNWQAKCIYELLLEYQKDIEEAIDEMLIIENFDNDRERGYTLKYKGKEISFAENRTSDNIVIYPFRWNTETKDLHEEFYDTKSKYFEYGKFQEVFNFILKYLGIEL